MQNIASVFKSEIARVARKQARFETASLKRAVISHRAEIAALKRRLNEFERQMRDLSRLRAASQSNAPAADTFTALRFSAKGLASNRRRLGLSVEACGRLVGATGQSINIVRHSLEKSSLASQSSFLACPHMVRAGNRSF